MLTDCLNAQIYSAVELKDLQKIDLISWGNDYRTFLGAVYIYKQAKLSDAYVALSGLLIEKQILDSTRNGTNEFNITFG